MPQMSALRSLSVALAHILSNLTCVQITEKFQNCFTDAFSPEFLCSNVHTNSCQWHFHMLICLVFLRDMSRALFNLLHTFKLACKTVWHLLFIAHHFSGGSWVCSGSPKPKSMKRLCPKSILLHALSSSLPQLSSFHSLKHSTRAYMPMHMRSFLRWQFVRQFLELLLPWFTYVRTYNWILQFGRTLDMVGSLLVV